MQCLLVGAGGFLGAIARFLIGLISGRLFATSFPVGTMIINLTGSLFLGWFMARAFSSEQWRLAIAVGFVGAYTTFSTWMYESDSLMSQGAGIKATVNLLGSVVLGLICVRFGIWLGGGMKN